jgi:hypothetical protein
LHAKPDPVENEGGAAAAEASATASAEAMSGERDVLVRQMRLRDVAAVFQIGEVCGAH